MSAQPPLDVAALVSGFDLSKDHLLEVVQAICRKLSGLGDEMMFMTVNLNKKTTTCIGSQIGIDFLNNVLPQMSAETLNTTSVSQLFQFHIEDHYEQTKVSSINTSIQSYIPNSPGSSIIMHSPSYTPFSPRPGKSQDSPMTPRIKQEVVDTEYEGNSSQGEDNSATPIRTTGALNPMTPTLSSVLKNLLVGQPNPPTPKVYPPYVPGKIRPDKPGYSVVTTQSSFTTPASTNVRALLTKLLSPGSKRPPVVKSLDSTIKTNDASNSIHTFDSNTTVTICSPGNKMTVIHPPPRSQEQAITSSIVYDNNKKPVHPAIQRIQDCSLPERSCRKRRRGDEDKDSDMVDSSSENESTESGKTVTLRSGRKVKVPSWRQDILEDNLKNNRKKVEEMSDIQIKQERVSPTFPDTLQDDDNGVRVEFDFDILADLKKEAMDEQSDNSSWSGTVMLTSEDDATPSKVPFKFTFPLKNKDNSSSNNSKTAVVHKSYDEKLSSLGLARKPGVSNPLTLGQGHLPVEGRFDYITVFEAVEHQGAPHFCCKLCRKVLPYEEGLKDHCFSHDNFLDHYFICEGCDKECSSSEELACHIQSHPKVHVCHIGECKSQFISRKSLIQHLNRVHNELYSCPRCNMTFITSKGLGQHMVACIDRDRIVSSTKAGVKLMNENWISVQDDGQILYKCRSCQTCFPTVEEYNQHMLQHKSKFVQQINQKFENVVNQSKPANSDKNKTCEICSTIFETEDHLKNHIASSHVLKVGEDSQLPTFKCKLCNVEFDSQVEFSGHCTKMHPQVVLVRIDDKGEFSCTICSKRMTTQEGLDTHMKMHNNRLKKQCTQCGTHLHLEASDELHCCVLSESKFKCEDCSLCFYNQIFLTGHREFVHEIMDKTKIVYVDGQPTCNICGRVFKKESEFQNHKTLHTGEHPHSCHLCQKTFRLRSTLKTHLMTHRDYHEFMCEICGRTFKLIESLRLHRRLHNKKCHFKCKHCDKEFRAYDGLKYHMIKDHKEAFKGAQLKIYKCEYCDKDMATHQQYVRHVSIHTNEKPLKCDQCDTRWATVSQLNAHKKKHDEENLKYSCCICNIKFPILSKLKRHIRTSKHIENCKLRNLPVNTTSLKATTSAGDANGSPSSSRIIDNVSNEEEKVEIMFYEINDPDEENELVDVDDSMVYSENNVIVENINNESDAVHVGPMEIEVDSEVQNSEMVDIECDVNNVIDNEGETEENNENSLDVDLECTEEVDDNSIVKKEVIENGYGETSDHQETSEVNSTGISKSGGSVGNNTDSLSNSLAVMINAAVDAVLSKKSSVNDENS